MSTTVPSAELRRLVKSADEAMLRAARRAREIAARTGTHLVVEKDGRLQKLVVDQAGRIVPAKTSQTKKPTE